MNKDNDYFGMAQDIKRMLERLHNTDMLSNLSFPIIPALDFELEAIDYREYCLDQPAILEMGE